MRPLHLRLQAFGSYPGEEVVDFTLFNGIGTFLVTGPTGSGKTTVFDAMVYALYGELPGQRKGEGETRSHHADPAVETFVEFEFEVDGARYKVRRSPKQERQAKRGSGTAQQDPTATLAKLQPDGSAVSIATKATACSKECAALVGLTSEQFQRVVLLPQGKFNEFLVASEGDREPLLSQLFGGALYTEAVDWLKSTMRQLESRVADDDQQIEHHRTNAVDALSVVRREWLGLDEPEVDSDGNDLRQLDIDALRALVQQATSDRDERERRVEVLEHSAADLHAQLGAAEEQANRFDADAEHRAVIAARESERDEVTAGMAAATRSATARPVVDAATQRDAADAAVVAADDQIIRLRVAALAGFAAVGAEMPEFTAPAVAAEIARIAEVLQQHRTTITTAAKKAEVAAAAVAERDRLATEHARAERAVAELDALGATLVERRAALAEAAAPLDDLRHRAVNAERDLGRRVELDSAVADFEHRHAVAVEANHAYREVHDRYVASQAARLAVDLQNGAACPVCGSVDHPAPARPDDGELVEASTLRAAVDALSAADSDLGSAEARVAQLRSELGTLSDRSADELRAAAAELRDAERVAADATERLVAADAELAGHAARVATATVAASGAALDLERAATLAMSATAEADRLAESMVANRIVPDEVEARLGAVEGLRALGDELGAAFEQVQRSTATASERERQLAAALETSGMPDVESAQAMLLDADLEARYRQRYTEWNDEMVTRTAMLEQLRQQGVPEHRPDTATLAAGASAAAAEAVGARSGFTTVADAAQRASSSLDAAESMLGQSADLRQQRDTARRVFDTCNGKGKVVGLERWVLGHELGRVVAAASVHLAVMSNHRYRLDRAAGLELEVFDSHTGRARSTASLSGGEQFQASLALALGLADVVSHGGAAAGTTFEALFVDEGFGSLDPDSLDLAIETLGSLQAGGRMVGAITHVEAMKQRLPVGIEVRRRPDGGGSTLVVLPR